MASRGITRFWTESSIYEIDFSWSLMRRLAGVRRPTTNQGADGRWRAFVTTSPLRVGDPVLVTWESLDDDVTPRTITSPVVGIADGESDDPPAWVMDMIRSAHTGGVDGDARAP
jgi:hypothetical protein